MSSKLANFLKVKREESGLSQKQLADQLGLKSGQFISNVERGTCSMPLDKCGQLCEILKIPKASLKAIIIFEHTKKINDAF